MLVTEVQDYIMKVFSRANKSLHEEIININKKPLLTERAAEYERIKKDFKNYSSLANDFLTEVDNNLKSELRPVEAERYVNDLNKYVFDLWDGYEYIESDEWMNKIYTRYHSALVFEKDKPLGPLSDEDRKYISNVVEEVRVCCYNYDKAADTVAKSIKGFLDAYKILPHRKNKQVPAPPHQTSTFNKESEQKEMAPIATSQPQVKEIQPVTSVQEPLEKKNEEQKDISLSVKLLIAEQSGLFTGDFHRLPQEKQYAILAELFGKSRANIKNAVTALISNANSDKNPRNLPSAVEKANEIINERGLGIPLVKGRKDSY